MRVLPGTHDKHLLKRRDLIDLDQEKYVLGVGIHPDQIDDSDAVDLELQRGRCFDPQSEYYPRFQCQYFGSMARWSHATVYSDEYMGE